MSRPSTRTSSSRLLIVLVVTTALGPFAMQVFLPALPAMQAEFHTSTATAQLNVSLAALSIALSMLAYGPIADRVGRRPAMIGGLCIFLFGSAVCFVASSIEMLIIGRVVQAAGGSAGLVLGRAIVRDLYGRDGAARQIALITTAMIVAPMVAPAIGGLIVDRVSWRYIFVLGGFVGGAALTAVWTQMGETHPISEPQERRPSPLGAFVRLLRIPAFCGFTICIAFSVGVFYAFVAAAPYLIVTVMHRPATEYGLLFILVSGGFMLGNLVAARISPAVGASRMVVIGSGGSLVATLVLFALIVAGFTGTVSLVLPTAIGAFGQGLSLPNAQAAAVSVDPSLAGSASGLAGFIQMTVAAIVAQAVGMAGGQSALPMAIGMTICAVLAFIGARQGARANLSES